MKQNKCKVFVNTIQFTKLCFIKIKKKKKGKRFTKYWISLLTFHAQTAKFN